MVSRETAPPAPEAARGVFASDRLPLAEAYAGWLADAGTVRGLIGPREVPRLWDRHLLNCAVLAEAIPAGARVCDIGSGAGLPGAGAGHRPPRRHGHPGRAAAAPDDVPRRGGGGSRARWGRRWCAAAPTNCTASERFDVVTSRAVAPLDRLLGWSMPLVAAPDGVLVAMKGDSAEDEIVAARAILAAVGVRGARGAGPRCWSGAVPSPRGPGGLGSGSRGRLAARAERVSDGPADPSDRAGGAGDAVFSTVESSGLSALVHRFTVLIHSGCREGT